MRTVVLVCAVTASAFIGPPVWASLCVLDQFQENQNYGYAVGDVTRMAQTFTANLEGVVSGQTVRLCHIEIGNTTGISWGDFWGEASPPVVEIRDTVENAQGLFQPGSTSLGSVDLSTPVPFDNWLSIDFLDQGIVLTTGQKYSIVLWADDHTGAVSVGAMVDPDSYSAGALWAWDELGDTWLLLSDLSDTPVGDMQFRTYVVPVPLPAGVWLGIFAVSVAGWHLKRQRG